MSFDLDTETSGSMGVDYGDFVYDTWQFEAVGDPNGGGNNSEVRNQFVAEYDPLPGRGGLNANEVAELVYQELHVHIEHEDDTGDQDVSSESEFRGSFGINLNTVEDTLNGASGDEWQQVDTNDDQRFITIAGEAETRPEILQPFQCLGAIPADDETNGTGSNGSGSVEHYVKNWRNLTGRGPILDATDNVAIAGRIFANDTVLETSAVIHGHLVWDTFEVDEAGRRFSVPR